MAHWLLKSEPETYSASDLERDGTTNWSGVRAPAARMNLRAMAKGDTAFLYHSGKDKAVQAVVEIARTAYPDEDPDWVQVDVKWRERLPRPVTLAEIKAHKQLAKMELVRQSRLSVSPVTDAQWQDILDLAKR
jgi:predicted RNA-binding protein with PUA-like domain